MIVKKPEQKNLHPNFSYISVDDLEFDKKNPRLPHSVINSNDEGDVIDWMLRDASIIELMGSIGEKGFFPGEPLLAILDKKTQKYIVVEGNRRLTAVKLLNDPNLATRRSQSVNIIAQEAEIKPDTLPVMVFPERKEIMDYLGFKHITGVKQWSALAKAKYLKELQKEYKSSNLSVGEQYKRLAKAIGSRSDYVRDLLIGLDVYDDIHKNKYFEIEGLNEDTIDFGVYYNALKFGNIPKYLGIEKTSENPTVDINQDNLKFFTKILSEKDAQGNSKLGESRNLTVLNDIILESRPLQMFISGKKSISEAALYLEGPHEVFRTSVLRTLSLLDEADTALKEVVKCTQSDVKLIDDVSKKVAEIKGNVQIKARKKSKA